ncbi:MAG: hypothetical protein AB7O97_23555 [Planctomycetota bacterium]
METTVTGMFADLDGAERAVGELERAGVARDAVAVITRETDNRHRLLGEETSDVARGALLGAVVGGVGMALGGLAMAELFDLHPALAVLGFGVLGAAAGTAIGVLIGSATGHQVQEEYEHLIDSGRVLLAVHGDAASAARVQGLLAQQGAEMLSTSVHLRRPASVPQVG